MYIADPWTKARYNLTNMFTSFAAVWDLALLCIPFYTRLCHSL